MFETFRMVEIFSFKQEGESFIRELSTYYAICDKRIDMVGQVSSIDFIADSIEAKLV